MFAKRITAGLLVVLLLLTCVCGCRKNEKKGGKREKSPVEQTEALLDDFCAYLKSSKYDKMAVLVDGSCNEIDKIRTFSRSEVSGILDACLKKFSYSVDDVKEDGTGTVSALSVSYIDTDALLGAIPQDATVSDVIGLIQNAEKKKCEYSFHAGLKETQWKIAAADASAFLEGLFGFIEKLDFSTTETVASVSKSFVPFSVYETYWYDGKYNLIPGLHETVDEVRYYVTTWDYYNDINIRYEFIDDKGNILEDGTCTMDGNSDIIDVALNPSGKLPVGLLTCKMYDPNNKCFIEGTIEVFPDGTRIPIAFEFTEIAMIDEAGAKVQEYPYGTEYIAAKLSSEVKYKDIRLDYKVFTDKDYKEQGPAACEGSLLPPDGQEDQEYILPLKPEDAKVLPEGKYYFVVYDMRGGEYWKVSFEVVPSPLSTETSESGTETVSAPDAKFDLSGMVICIDPGHQAKANSDTEPLAPWSDEQKAKVSAGTSGVATKRPEHEVNLEIGLKLRDHLVSLGAKVVMTRETADVDVSNIQRAKIAVDCNADVFLRLHCDAAESADVRGVGVFVCSKGDLADKQVKWGEMLGKCYAEATGAKYRGCNASTTYSGLNWANTVPSFLLEMGYMSNEEDDRLLSDPEYQDKICEGIADFCFKMKNKGE